MTEIGFGVDVHEMCHAVIVAVPEVVESPAGAARHTPVIHVAGKVCLA